MKKYVLALLAAVSLTSIANAEEPRLQDNVPETHTVVKGDTLWDISGTFLKNPWMWPEIWHVNAQIDNPHLIYPGDVIRLIYMDGKPRLTLDNSGRIYKLEPKAHVLSTGEAIDTIPLDRINNFLSKSRIVGIDELQLAPYIVSGADDHLIVGAGDRAYVRGNVGEERTVYGVYRQGDQYIDPETKEVLGVMAQDIGSGFVESIRGEIATLEMTRTVEEVRAGDRLLREDERSVDTNFYPSAPNAPIEGQILAVEGGVSQVGRLDVVIINRGERELVKVGNVLAVYKRGNKIKDRVAGGWVTLPDEKAGMVMIFRVFDKISLGLVLEAKQGLKVKDRVVNP